MNGEPLIGSGLVIREEGNPTARLASLFDAHSDRLYRLARRLSGSADEARDLVQEVFVRAARRPKAIPTGMQNEEAWLVRVLLNIRKDLWRKTAVRIRHAQDVSISDPGSNRPVGHDSALVARMAVWQALDRLNPRRRAILVMYELEGLSVAEIASLLDIATVTVRWHLSKGRRDVARALKARTGDKS
jgi:RNA polymerase sigma-70 factor (ECF subfamily)